MNGDPLPPDLIDLEARLRDRPNLEPSDLRQNVLRAVVAELAMTRQWNLPYWGAAAAAAVFMFLNLSMISATHGEFSIRPAASDARISAEFQALRQFESQPEGTLK